MRSHTLKTWPGPFQAVLDGIKTFEFRRDDRGFEVGDLLLLREWDPTPQTISAKGYTGREITVRVTYLIGGRFGVPDGFVVMSIAKLDEGSQL